MVSQVPINGSIGDGKFALIDDDDYALVMGHSWHYRDGYAITKHAGHDLRMHRLVTNTYNPDTMVDHINRERLDNRKSNLRRFTPKQNANNRCDNRKIYAFGEYRTIAEWAADPICKVSYDILYGRLRKEIDPVWAMLAEAE